MATCTQCGHDNVATARFCNGCGGSLVDVDAPGARKTVTVVFCDLVGSTALGERSDPEVLRDLMARYHAELSVQSERLGAGDDYYNESVWRSVRAQVWSARGRHADAVTLAREAAELADRTQMVDHCADMHADLARVLLAAGDAVAAGQAGRHALRIYEQKGNLVGAARTRALLAASAR